jgi:hypothetical protein
MLINHALVWMPTFFYSTFHWMSASHVLFTHSEKLFSQFQVFCQLLLLVECSAIPTNVWSLLFLGAGERLENTMSAFRQ